jgi:hypothetical protein
MANPNKHVAEIQGLYGPYTMAERVVQKIWLREDFNHVGASLVDGRKLTIRSTGAWNLLGGPDFLGARLMLDQEAVVGDVEVHFRASDWRAHGHHTDSNYDNVALHVVLFPLGADERPAWRSDGGAIPTLVLLPLLYRDLEDYASDDALEAITAQDEWRHVAVLAGKPVGEVQELLARKASERWQQKVHYARLRIGKLGWSAAAHSTALEILGYRHNRVAMLDVAERYSLTAWADGIDPLQIFSEMKPSWRLQGLRPANHPLTRLRQYQRWTASDPAWPEKLRLLDPWLESSPAPASGQSLRQSLHLQQVRALALSLTGNTLSGSRLDNLVCDGLLPLMAARAASGGFELWFHWFMGDVPERIRRVLPKLGVTDGRRHPLCHGYGQGLLGWFWECEARASG